MSSNQEESCHSAHRDDDESKRLAYVVGEARALEWKELLPSSQEALRSLLRVLFNATHNSSNSEASTPPVAKPLEQLSTSILISGERGFGKSTILLTAQYATGKGEAYFQGIKDDPAANDCKSFLKKLTKLRWLETLDLESVPSQANLLATLLVRIRDALDRLYPETRSRGLGVPSTILEEGLEKPWKKLDRLIREATFMWEDVFGSNDPRRERADQQITAAEILARFQKDFKKAIGSVAMVLGRESQEQDAVLVLPIDHVDRSIEHLYSIVTLLEMASSPQLWFLLAAGREDFQLFLERALQRELLSGDRRARSQAIVGLDPSSLDQTRAIARYQAAATLLRTIPIGYRVRIDPARDAVAFVFPKMELLESLDRFEGALHGDGSDCLVTFLRALKLPKRTKELSSFADLLLLRHRLDGEAFSLYREACIEDAREDESQHGSFKALQRSQTDAEFTFAARMALNLSARGLRDLWQEAHRRTIEGEEEANLRAPVHIAVRMLKTAIDESTLPFWASDLLLNRIVRKDARGHWILDLSGNPIRPSNLTTVPEALELWPKRRSAASHIVRSQLQLRRITDINLELHDSSTNHVPLPPAVAGWFMILHDLLSLVERVSNPSLDRLTPQDMMPELVVTRHELLCGGELVPLEFAWRLPSWDTFFDFFIFAAQWRTFLHWFRGFIPGTGSGNIKRGPAQDAEMWRQREARSVLFFQTVLAAWIDNACSVARPQRGHWRFWIAGDRDRAKLLEHVLVNMNVDESSRYDACVRAEILGLHQDVRALGFARLGRNGRALAWLEVSLPLLTLPEHAPFDSTPLLAGRGAEWTASLDDLWVQRRAELIATREDLVRRAAEESARYRELCEPGRAGGGTVARKWLDRVVGAWFKEADADAQHRRSLKGVAWSSMS